MAQSDATNAEFSLDPILEALDRHKVEYLLVGGNATQIYGATRPTYDFDCLPRATDENLDRLGAALNELGARVRSEGLDDETARMITPKPDARFFKNVMISNFRTDAGDLDVLHDMPAHDGTKLTFDDLASRAEHRSVGGVTVAVASLDDIIASKQHANRDKDRAALPELYRLSAEASERRRAHD